MSEDVIADALEALAAGSTFTEDEAYRIMQSVMSGACTPERLAGLLMGLRLRGETIDEITGFARAMRDNSLRIHPKVTGRLTDTCGTGGAPFKTFNISTASAFVAAGGGVPIAKHGNRSVTSPSGSADVLEALGADLARTPNEVSRIIEATGIGFLFAPSFHPAMKYAAPARKALGIRTVFNVLGPLTNPARADAQVLGVFDPSLCRPLAHVLARLGTRSGMVVHGHGGLDEASTLGPTTVARIVDGKVHDEMIDPTDVGFQRATPEGIAGLPPAEGAAALREILRGAPGPRADIVILNAACALVVGGEANDLPDGIEAARAAIADGRALGRLDAYVAATRDSAILGASP